MQQVAVLRQGQCFGELALISNKPRAATVVSRENSHFAVLERKAYTEILASAQHEALSEKVSLLQRHPVFCTWTKSAVQRLSYFFKTRMYTRKQMLFHAGEPANEVFIIKRGELQLSQDVTFQKKRALVGSTQGEVTHCQVHVTIISDGEMIGAEEAIKQNKHLYTCRCHSTQSEVLVISQEDFRGQMSNDQAVNYLQTMTRLKESYRLERVLQASELVRKERFNTETVPTARPRNNELEQSAVLKEVLLRNTINSIRRGLTVVTPERAFQRHPSTELPSVSRQLPDSISSLPLKSTPARHYQRTWSEICASKFPVERSDKCTHRRQQSFVNFHTQLMRKVLRKQDFQAQGLRNRAHEPSLSLVSLRLVEVPEPC